MRAGHKVLTEVDDNIWVIVGEILVIFDQQLRPHPIYLLNITIIIINYIMLFIIEVLYLKKTIRPSSPVHLARVYLDVLLLIFKQRPT